MSVQYPDYQNCIANLACSVLAHYGITPPNPTLPAADALLKAHPAKHVLVLLIDGMGVSNMEMHLAPQGFFRSHLVTPYSSTFPPTTVAATTAMLSGLTPNQSGWLGWAGYFPQVDRNVVYNWNADNDTGEAIRECNVPWTYVPYRSLQDRIAGAGTQAYTRLPFQPPWQPGDPPSLDTFLGEVEALCAKDEPSYIYAYWDALDTLMHKNGVEGEAVGQLMRQIEKRVEEMSSRLTDTLLLITADHGHISTRKTELLRCPELAECLVRMPSIELRTVNLFVKPGMEKQLEAAFAKYFPDQFMLLTKEQVLDMQLFGTGENHPLLEGMLGEYIAIAISDMDIVNTPSDHRGNHAGITPEEMTIPLIALSC